ncbi:30814_t:CDS:2, partial [Racocetra persica]
LDHSKDDLDITEYFDKSFYCNKDISNITNNIESVSLKKGDSFDDFDEAEFYICRFSESKGFKIQLGRVKMINTAENSKEVHKRTILYKHSGLFRPKNAAKSNTPHVFEYYWNQLIGFSATKLYLECHLYNRRFLWVRAFTAMIFILGIQITSFVESQNACINRVLENSNTLLCDLDVPSMTNATTIFLSIESLVKCYLRPNVAYFLVEQIKESLYYTASHAIVEEIESLTSYESSQSEDIDDEPDAIVLYTMYLLEHLEYTSIVEIWKISRVTSQGVNHFIILLSDDSYSCTCLLQQ